MVLKNLLRQAWDREQTGAQAPVAAPPVQPPPSPKTATKRTAPAAPSKSANAFTTELAKLDSLRSAGVLTDEEFENARKRLLAKTS
jgi:hypothetical protein